MSKPASIEDVEKRIQEAVGMTEKEFKEYFQVELDPARPGVAVVRWRWLSEYASFKALIGCIEGMGGKRTATYTAEVPLVTKEVPLTTSTPSMHVVKPEPAPIPLEPAKAAPAGAGFEPATTAAKSPIPESEDEVAYLRSTYERLGALSPVLRAPSGEVIDGKHRLQVDPGWFSLVIHGINDPVKVAMARLIINICRREVPAEEKTQLLTDIAKLTGWTPQQISEATGMSLRWVYQYLPAELKGPEPEEFARARLARQEESSQVKVMPEAPGVEARRAETTGVPRVCDRCGVQTFNFTALGDETLCIPCYNKAMTVPPTTPEAEVPAGPPEAPKPEPLDVAEFTCPECHQEFRIVHVRRNLHRFVPYKKNEEPKPS